MENTQNQNSTFASYKNSPKEAFLPVKKASMKNLFDSNISSA